MVVLCSADETIMLFDFLNYERYDRLCFRSSKNTINKIILHIDHN